MLGVIYPPSDFLRRFAGGIAGIAGGFLLGSQRGGLFDLFGGNERFKLFLLALRLGGEFGLTCGLLGQFGFARQPGGFALGHAGGTRLGNGEPLQALFFEGGVLRLGAKLFQHRLFHGGGILLTFMQVGALEAQRVLLGGKGRGAYMARGSGLRNLGKSRIRRFS